MVGHGGRIVDPRRTNAQFVRVRRRSASVRCRSRLLVACQQNGCQDRRRQAGVYTRRWKVLGGTTRRATSKVVSPRPACASWMRGPDQRHEAPRRPRALSLSRSRRNTTLGRLGRGQQQPLGADHSRPPTAQTTLKNSPPTENRYRRGPPLTADIGGWYWLHFTLQMPSALEHSRTETCGSQ
jgi:hypothetical protein